MQIRTSIGIDQNKLIPWIVSKNRPPQIGGLIIRFPIMKNSHLGAIPNHFPSCPHFPPGRGRSTCGWPSQQCCPARGSGDPSATPQETTHPGRKLCACLIQRKDEFQSSLLSCIVYIHCMLRALIHSIHSEFIQRAHLKNACPFTSKSQRGVKQCISIYI